MKLLGKVSKPDEDGYIEARVEVELYEMLGNDIDSFDDLLDQVILDGKGYLSDISMTVCGCGISRDGATGGSVQLLIRAQKDCGDE
jgi:hypothetical protein